MEKNEAMPYTEHLRSQMEYRNSLEEKIDLFSRGIDDNLGVIRALEDDLDDEDLIEARMNTAALLVLSNSILQAASMIELAFREAGFKP